MFHKIGEKIKLAAILLFIVEALPAFIYGIRILAKDYNSTYTTIGTLLLIIGPIIAYVSAIMLYGFGELVESSRENAETSKKILKNLETNPQPVQPNVSKEEPSDEPTPVKKPLPQLHSWRCACCGNRRNQSPCEHCGKV